MPEFKRLHISPLNPDLLTVVVPKPVLPLASGISYHSIQSSPDSGYGYVTLPTAEADKIQKKFNGFILKGKKMRIGEARPEKGKRKLENDDVEEVEGSATKKVRKEKKKSKREEGILPGVELPKERKVKRGWTEAELPAKQKKEKKEKKEKKSKLKSSSYTNEPELLFKTKVPPNVAPLEEQTSTINKKSKKRKKGEVDREVIVHEFTNTTKQPAFLRDALPVNSKKGASEYVEGKGWVDEAGNLVEEESKARQTRSKAGTDGSAKEAKAPTKKAGQAPKVEIPIIGLSTPTNTSPQLLNEDKTSSSGSSTDSDSAAESQSIPPPLRKPNPSSASPTSSASSEASSPRLNRLSITRSSATPPPISLDPLPHQPPSPPQPPPHPLETLFKRPSTAASATPRKPNLEVTTSFSFFDQDVEEAPLTGVVGLLAPQTPFTRRDLSERGQRSAAPTPDTAMPGKGFWGLERGVGGDEDDDGDVSGPEGYILPGLGEREEGEGEGSIDKKDGDQGRGTEKLGERKEKKEKEAGESEFAKEFWEKRGERNRAAKKRVREAKKEKRRADGKKRSGRD